MGRKTHWMVMAMAVAALLSSTPAAANTCGGRPLLRGAHRISIIGLTDDQRLVRFRVCGPDRLKEIGAVSGLGGSDTALVGIDFRVQNGLLYGVGNGGGIYTLDTDTAAATPVSQLAVALQGTLFGVDFNPAADRLRVISDTGQNLRHNLNDGTTANDGTLNFATVTAPGVTGAAYTNNDLDTNTGTTLFDIDSTTDQVVIQSPPNNGSLIATGKLTVDTASSVGFDIYTILRDDVAVENRGFASLVVGGVPGFYRVNQETGKATLIGEFEETVVDIAVPLDQ